MHCSRSEQRYTRHLYFRCYWLKAECWHWRTRSSVKLEMNWLRRICRTYKKNIQNWEWHNMTQLVEITSWTAGINSTKKADLVWTFDINGKWKAISKSNALLYHKNQKQTKTGKYVSRRCQRRLENSQNKQETSSRLADRRWLVATLFYISRQLMQENTKKVYVHAVINTQHNDTMSLQQRTHSRVLLAHSQHC